MRRCDREHRVIRMAAAGPGPARARHRDRAGPRPSLGDPAFVLRGASPGPTLVVTAGMHAAEYPPIEAVTRLCRTTDPASLSGTLVGVPLVNSPAFFERTIYVNPRDGKNVNRMFPGDATGTDSQRVARYLTDTLLAEADAYVDVHAGDLIEALVPFTLYARTRNAEAAGTSRAMAASYVL